MTMINKIETYLKRFPLVAAVLYVAAVTGFVAATAAQVLDLEERDGAVAAATAALNQLEGRGGTAQRAMAAGAGPVVAGSPFLEGETVTVAGAALLQRVAGAVTHVGGNVLSSQVDLQGPQAKQGFVVVTASCELEQPALQQLLYDVEAGMPFLFVDQLDIQAPAAGGQNAGEETRKLRLLISVSGQWQGPK